MDPLTAIDLQATISESVTNVFDTMLSLEVAPIDANQTEQRDENRFVGVVKFAGEMVGIVNIQLSYDFARYITAAMLDMDEGELEGEEEIQDLIAELSNIIGGKLKSSYTDIGLYCELSPPLITKGTDFTIESLNMEIFERYAFAHNDQIVWIEAGVKQGSTESDEIKAKKSNTPRKPIDVERFKALDVKKLILDTVTEVFDTMLSMEVALNESVSRSSIEGQRTVGSVNFAGDITGIINIHVSNTFARHMTASMLGMALEEIEGQEEINDLIGELGNIIGGSLKSTYTDIGMICELSTPSITNGSDFLIEALNMTSYDRLAFRCQDFDLFVELGLKVAEEMLPESGISKEVHYDVHEDDLSAAETSAAASQTDLHQTNVSLPSENSIDSEVGSGGEGDEDSIVSVGVQQEPPNAHADAGIGTAQNSEEPLRSVNGGVDMDVILDIPLEITVELGRTKMPIHDLLSLEPGSAVTLSRLEGEPVDILANNTLIARGVVMVKGEKYAIQITEITSRLDRIRSLR